MIDFTIAKNLVSKFTVTGAQKAHIDRLVFELGILEKQVAALSQKLIDKDITISNLEGKLTELTTKNKELQMKLAQYEQRDEVLDEKEEQVLRFFFKAARELSAEDIVRELGWEKGEVDHFISDLLRIYFLARTRPPTRGGPRGDTPAMYKIEHLGSTYIMKKG